MPAHAPALLAATAWQPPAWPFHHRRHIPRSVQSVWAPGGRREVDEAKARCARDWICGQLLSIGCWVSAVLLARPPVSPHQCTAAGAPAAPSIYTAWPTLHRPCRFAVAEGDLIAYLNVWKGWEVSSCVAAWAGAGGVGVMQPRF